MHSLIPPNHLRCDRDSGGGWRCKGWRIHDQKVCETHYIYDYSRRMSTNSHIHLSLSHDNDGGPHYCAKRLKTHRKNETQKGDAVLETPEMEMAFEKNQEKEEEREKSNDAAFEKTPPRRINRSAASRLQGQRQQLYEEQEIQKSSGHGVETLEMEIDKSEEEEEKEEGSVKSKSGEHSNGGVAPVLIESSRITRNMAHKQRQLLDENHLNNKQAVTNVKTKNPSNQKCHQCRHKTVEAWCNRCECKRYCLTCINKWYSHMSKKAIEEACPLCRGNCNCLKCFRKKGTDIKDVRVSMNKDENIWHLKYLVYSLYPFLKRFNKKQKREKLLEAKIRGRC